jgi:hypothetical protein
VFLGICSAFAQAGSPTSEGSASGSPSGHEKLDAKACQEVRRIESPNGETLSRERPTPFVVECDTYKTGRITAAVFQAGCSQGSIQKPGEMQ